MVTLLQTLIFGVICYYFVLLFQASALRVAKDTIEKGKKEEVKLVSQRAKQREQELQQTLYEVENKNCKSCEFLKEGSKVCKFFVHPPCNTCFDVKHDGVHTHACKPATIKNMHIVLACWSYCPKGGK